MMKVILKFCPKDFPSQGKNLILLPREIVRVIPGILPLGRKRGRDSVLSPQGFTLIELVLVIIVLGLTAVPLSLMIAEHIEGAVFSQDQTMAQQLGRMEMEAVKNLTYANIVTVSFLSYRGYGFDVTRTVSYAAGDAGSPESLKVIRVDVRKSGQSQILSTLVSCRARNISYGV